MKFNEFNMNFMVGDKVRIKDDVVVTSHGTSAHWQGRIGIITDVVHKEETYYEIDNAILLRANDLERIVSMSFASAPLSCLWVSEEESKKHSLTLEDAKMKIRIKKMRENAKLPEFKNGNWMDTYISLAGFVSQNHEDPDDYEVRGEFTFDDVIWWNNEDNKTYQYAKGDILVFKLGFALELPKGKELHLLPRSGTFRKYGLILTNSMGIGDDTYIGDNDEYMAIMYATREGSVSIGDRLIQMKIEDAMPEIELVEVEEFGNADRNGFGSTGR